MFREGNPMFLSKKMYEKLPQKNYHKKSPQKITTKNYHKKLPQKITTN